jgi:hypothetical protein
MSHQPANSGAAARTRQDPALQAAWQRFLEFDRQSIRQKETNRRIRIPIILLTLLATVLAVVISYKETNDFIKDISEALRVTIIIVPLVAAGLMTYAYQFYPSLSWITYRVGAELIRQHIYLYRMEAGEYAQQDLQKQQKLLLGKVGDASERVSQIGASVPYLQTDIENLTEQVKSHTDNEEDDGFSRMQVDAYIIQRVMPQREWYIDKLHDNYKKLRVWRTMVIIFTAMSSALAALGGEPLVAITTAIGVALGMYIQLQMYGATYAIYHSTAIRVGTELSAWSILTPEQKQDPARAASLVANIEKIFQEERDAWFQQASQAQMATEKALMKNLGFEVEQQEPVGE